MFTEYELFEHDDAGPRRHRSSNFVDAFASHSVRRHAHAVFNLTVASAYSERRRANAGAGVRGAA
jgi:hypothetical protein